MKKLLKKLFGRKCGFFFKAFETFFLFFPFLTHEVNHHKQRNLGPMTVTENGDSGLTATCSCDKKKKKKQPAVAHPSFPAFHVT